MKTKTEEFNPIDPALMAELQEAVEKAIKGLRTPDTMRAACERMDRTREAIRQRCGLLDFSVPTIRALRDGDEA